MRVPRHLPAVLEDSLRGFLLYKLATVALNFVTFRTLAPAPRLAWPRVSILVPARDEADNLPRTLPSWLAQGAHEVIVLDDGSTDGTADVARALGVRVVTGRPVPPGWIGKTWACQQLSEVATGDVLVFTDADVTWHEGALDAIVGALTRTRADLLTVWPRQETLTPGERVLVPLNDVVLLTLLPAPLVGLPFASASAGNGQLMAFRRAAYERVGGHRVVRGELLEDVKFAARLKARGGKLAIALGGEFLTVRMYGGYRESTRGFAKGLSAAHADSRALLLASWGWNLLAYTWPWLAGRRDLVFFAVLERLMVLLKTGRSRPMDFLEVLLTPLLPLLALPVYLRAMGRRSTWKGRTYEREKVRRVDDGA